jgi:hypothetical protein
VVLDSEHVKGSPFASNIYDVNQVKVSGLSPAGVSFLSKTSILCANKDAILTESWQSGDIPSGRGGGR